MKDQKWIEINKDDENMTKMLAINMPTGIIVQTITWGVGDETKFSTAFVPGLRVLGDGTVIDE